MTRRLLNFSGYGVATHVADTFSMLNLELSQRELTLMVQQQRQPGEAEAVVDAAVGARSRRLQAVDEEAIAGEDIVLSGNILGRGG